ncbi:glycyl-tRNA synthetase [Clostridium sp. CAG:798]|jgi:glycyl-tRNA synthetase|nr:glycyl-tRNA synthetase [Clostridium sp. CAG:798]HBJ11991.1 glycine--tRNA ligase [Clostridiales bacterium]
MADLTMDKIVSLCKNRGFIFQGSEIYGGLANTWDYGPLGARLKNAIKDTWRKRFVQERKNSYEIDADILMHPRVWEASGHVSSFSDPLLDCKECKTRHRADNLISDFNPEAHAEGMTQEEMLEYIKENNIPCPKCGKCNFTDIRQFNLMFQTYRGVTNDSKSIIYLRPENAQGEYVNFLNVQRTTRAKLPFSIAQIGKAFRNEITPGNFTFRTIEFEQMEFQTFCKEGTDEEIYNYFKEYGKKYYMDLGLPEEKLRFHDHEKLVFYAKAACDIEYLFPSIGWGEINGTHNRTNYDLSRHQEFSGVKQEYLDVDTNEKFIPYIIESTYGLDRTVLAVLCEAYDEEEIAEGDVRTVLHLHPAIAPYKIAVLPLSKKLSKKADELYTKLSKKFMCDYDEAGSIGKRYRRQDEIGTPYCITVDFDTLEDNTVTIRDRDTMEQIRININEIENWMKDKFEF